ncbi:LysR family transcriptional regulator [Variovorax sp. YR216]|uniref:LysR family transcriptional regulator n=1 Tax=Variovorax sp. YR216 TaxID=1882828 RepID=UPI00089CDBEC|nr:LysR family transcriptional regulator [Variovorax sp. YR216]SEB23499.1 DNA-binding transcriptional regulator, LysR family [Variovorax sp. YR216]
MNITLRQLRAFVEVVRSGGFTAASHKLHLTQSATSLLIRELEAQLGLQLVDRTTRQIAVTEAGSELLRSAERILGDVEQVVANAQDLVSRRRGRVTIAATPFLSATYLPHVIASFQESYPGITVHLADLPTDQILRMVQSGDADFGLGLFPQLDADLQRVPMLKHRMGVMVPSTWPLARRRRDVTWADLVQLPMIAMTHHSGYRALVDPYLHETGVALTPRFEVGHIGTAVGLAEAGLGVTVVPAYVGQLMRSSRVRFRVLHKPVVHRQIELAIRAARSLSPGATAFRECLEAHCKRLA